MRLEVDWATALEEFLMGLAHLRDPGVRVGQMPEPDEVEDRLLVGARLDHRHGPALFPEQSHPARLAEPREPTTFL